MADIPNDAPKPRLCHIIKWPDFDGYGFNLHADKSRPGQYIGKVDENSPADLAGLKEGDRILEVNGVNILNENHKQVVQRIKNIPNETKLLVVDSETDRWYKDKNIIVRGDQTNILYGTSIKSSAEPSVEEPEKSTVEQPATNGDVKKVDDGDSHSVSSAQSSLSDRSAQQQLPPISPDISEHQEIPAQEEKPAPVGELDASEVADSLTDYDNVIFVQENERREENIHDNKSDELKEPELAADKLKDCTEDLVGLTLKDDSSIKSDKDDVSINSDEDNTDFKTYEDDKCIKNDDYDDDDSIKSDKGDSDIKKDEIDGQRLSVKDDESSNCDKNSEKDDETSDISSLNKDKKDVRDSDSRSLSLEQESSTSTKCIDELTFDSTAPKAEMISTHNEEIHKSSTSTTPTPPPPAEPEAPAPKPEVKAEAVSKPKSSMNNGGLNLNMTVAEMRAQLAAKKKFDPRKDSIDLKKKYQIIQNM